MRRRSRGAWPTARPCRGQILDHIVTKTDGVPLFVEELTKTVLESGLLQEREDRYELCRAAPAPRDPGDAPRFAHGASRPARVRPEGGADRECHRPPVLRTSCWRPSRPWTSAELDAALDELVDAQLVLCDGTPPRAIYSFKHALVQDAAYGSLLLAQRQALHARIAEVLETQFPETLEASPELVAHHWTEAHLGPKALHYLAIGRPTRERAVGQRGGDLPPDEGAGSRRDHSRERRAPTPGARPAPRLGPRAHEHEGAQDARGGGYLFAGSEALFDSPRLAPALRRDVGDVADLRAFRDGA